MSVTRNNHYVPQWYQKGFFEEGKNTLAYLDLTPPKKKLADGREIPENSLFSAPTSRAFSQLDLYSTFFGTSVNDEIERRLFGDIDTRGSTAVRAFLGNDVNAQHTNFLTFFEYIDIQKTRTPKGLDWLRAQYPELTQNELMMEMQSIRMLHCTIWTEGVREIVSAEDADIKFLVSDHPVTIYNHAAAPTSKLSSYPLDPGIALKGSQTIFPLNRNFCLILSNLEYARDPNANPLEKRSFPRNFRHSMARTDAFIRTRELSDNEVARINFILKSRAKRYIAAGRKEWLYPEKQVTGNWSELAETLRPPTARIWLFGGEMFAKYDSGHVHYQDEFGRTEKTADFLAKKKPEKPLTTKDACGCGSGLRFGDCCQSKPVSLRRSWDELSIRERNLMLLRGIIRILGITPGRNWLEVRRELTDEKISEVYRLFAALWPLETDMLRLLPKPDGTPRAVYTGLIHPHSIGRMALGACCYFGELFIEHPFMHPRIMKKEVSPIEKPGLHRHEFIKSVMFIMKVQPFIEAGLIELVPDLCYFDPHLRQQRTALAETHSREIERIKDPRIEALMKADTSRSIGSMPEDILRAYTIKAYPGIGSNDVDNILADMKRVRERDDLAALHATIEGGEQNGELAQTRLAPNYEMAMYLAQAIGGVIFTDSPNRWQEITHAVARKSRRYRRALPSLAETIEKSEFVFPEDFNSIHGLAADNRFSGYHRVIRESVKYLSRLTEPGASAKPNLEASLAARFSSGHQIAQKLIRQAGLDGTTVNVSCLFPEGGIQDNTINRLLLMSSSEHHLPSVPMAFYLTSSS
ncbi:hypothetical protein J2W42_000941 [Rhizobium tibeticum]|uniref:DUF4238 domain-containing protein n=1 Tax=Rhizobium tibeticum TaxID=501024 RepID=UPI00278B67AF|nr:DUF4238 domain-containing protein [Rhizobium tibeticum]MDP9808103.1 hypothetical protein [Rhizobium tibeticum]